MCKKCSYAYYVWCCCFFKTFMIQRQKWRHTTRSAYTKNSVTKITYHFFDISLLFFFLISCRFVVVVVIAIFLSVNAFQLKKQPAITAIATLFVVIVRQTRVKWFEQQKKEKSNKRSIISFKMVLILVCAWKKQNRTKAKRSFSIFSSNRREYSLIYL